MDKLIGDILNEKDAELSRLRSELEQYKISFPQVVESNNKLFLELEQVRRTMSLKKHFNQ